MVYIINLFKKIKINELATLLFGILIAFIIIMVIFKGTLQKGTTATLPSTAEIVISTCENASRDVLNQLSSAHPSK